MVSRPETQRGGNLYDKVVDKIRFQWTTMKKAFKDLSMKGFIDEARLLHYVKHWSLGLEEGEFQILLKKLDNNGDGRISYADFQNTIGKDTHPKEFFYFR